jgi:hypothetical protein
MLHFRCNSQENLSSLRKKPSKSSKTELFSRLCGQLQNLGKAKNSQEDSVVKIKKKYTEILRGEKGISNAGASRFRIKKRPLQ